MKNRMKFFFILSLFFCFQKTYAQYIISLETKNAQIQNSVINIQIVSDKLLPNKLNLGEVFVSKSEKRNIGFSKNTKSGVLNYFKRYNASGSKPQILIEIKTFELSEKLNQNLVSGQIKLETSAYSVFDGDTSKLCNTRSSSNYQRNLPLKDLSNINQQVQICLDNALIYVLAFVNKNKNVLENFATDSKVIIRPFKVYSAIDTVFYQQRKVNWNDFKGPIRSKSDYGAAIFTSFGFESKLFTDKGIITMEITPKVYMDKNMSWARPGMKDDYGLAHEQLHFDIAYWQTLLFLGKIKSFKAKSEKDLVSMVNYEYLEFYKILTKVQNDYDSETNHSIIKPMQQKWAVKVSDNIKGFKINTLYQ